MEIGLVGLGKMGFNLALNLSEHGVQVMGCDPSKDARDKLNKEGIQTCSCMKSLVDKLPDKKVIWLMVPSGEITESCISEIKGLLKKGDIVIDAGNSNYKDSMRHAVELEEKEIQFLDVGTSGGISGARNGACLMIGGDRKAYEYLENVFHAISEKDGCLYTGKSGSGHFMKMIHNGIEYGMMQAIGEGFQILEKSEFNYNLAEVAKNWNHGSVIRGWLMELAQKQFSLHPGLKDIKGVVAASGEAKWTVETALELESPVPIIALSLMIRNSTLEEDNFSCKVVSALRNGFGGHSYVSLGEEK
ncbi:phosphogluconate dehydrogenase (NAD(+)-dependent, decarboxylating) [Erysipelotrichaceae bacterium HCN-30851]